MSVIFIFLIFSMLVVLYFDVTRYIIPNWLVGLMLLAYPAAVMMARNPIDWKMAIVGMTVVLVCGYLVFAMKWMGGGDIKLITACALWVGLRNLPDFIFITALIGGAFSLGVWGFRKALPHMPVKPFRGPTPRILRDGEPVPYGVAISFGFLLMIWTGKIPAIL